MTVSLSGTSQPADWKPIDKNTPRGVRIRLARWVDFGYQIEWRTDIDKLPYRWRFLACRKVYWTHWDYCPEPPKEAAE